MSWNKIGMELEITGDGSPSLHLIEQVHEYRPHGETMHHSGGAASETNLIYGSAIRECFQTIFKPEFMIVGLGLGYIEISIVRELLLANKSISDLGRILSFESVPELRAYFTSWIFNEALPEVIQKTYDAVLESCLAGLADSQVSSEQVKKCLRDIYVEGGKGVILGALESEFTSVGKFHCILYDAFSSKTTPHLWEEEFLDNFLEISAHDDLIFSTYACRGSLKRALKKHQVVFFEREGFKGKKKSSLGLRGSFLK